MGRRTNIFTVVSRNFRRQAVTLRFPDRPAPDGEFRGSVGIDTAKCLTCGICDYVCVSGAISVEGGESGMDWRYEPGRCTFCGRCVDHCPGDRHKREPDHLRGPFGHGRQFTPGHHSANRFDQCAGRWGDPHRQRGDHFGRRV